MALEITGKVLQILEVQSGEGKNGPWQKGGFVMEAGERFPKKVCCQVWSEMLEQVKALREGEMVKAYIDIESREYNGRWYTDVRPWKLEKLETSPVQPQGGTPPAAVPPSAPDTGNSGPEPSTEDDLPF